MNSQIRSGSIEIQLLREETKNFIDNVQYGVHNLLKKLDDCMKKLDKREEQIQLLHNKLNEKEEYIKKLENKVELDSKQTKNKIKINVGGTVFVFAKNNLLEAKGTYFEIMLSSGHWEPDEDGEYFINRNPKCFGIIADYLRTGEWNFSKEELTKNELKILKDDITYYQLNCSQC
eukprot:TRINITY_DN2521_c0_g1_i4.p1 TRINITY_DN2521_c0_g1~~TRINITY_DN2521_c0_g1_i4.p1  ORF type:complete len:175 (-),score=45.52 TRINITY_DN2521_c0_g1_i4:97-621(-)